MSETPMVTFSSVDNPNTWNIEGESKCLVFASPSEAKRAEELFTAMQLALTAERERADRNQEDAERISWLQLYATMAESDNPDEVEAADENGDSLREIFIANGGDLRAAIDSARRK